MINLPLRAPTNRPADTAYNNVLSSGIPATIVGILAVGSGYMTLSMTCMTPLVAFWSGSVTFAPSKVTI